MNSRLNHEIYSLRPECIQWNGFNAEEIFATLMQSKDIISIEVVRLFTIQIKNKNGVETINIGDWCVFGEDGRVSIYTDEQINKLDKPPIKAIA